MTSSKTIVEPRKHDLSERLTALAGHQLQVLENPVHHEPDESETKTLTTARSTIPMTNPMQAYKPTVASEIPKIEDPVNLVSHNASTAQDLVEQNSLSQSPRSDIEFTEDYLHDEVEIRLALDELTEVAVAKSRPTQRVSKTSDSAETDTKSAQPAAEIHALVSSTE